MPDPTLRPLFYKITEPDFQDWGDCGEIREEKVARKWSEGVSGCHVGAKNGNHVEQQVQSQ
jgi:hypothetical protein